VATAIAVRLVVARAQVYMEGPCGAPALNLDSDRYKCVLLVSGGIGITPMQSICNDLWHQHGQGRPLKKMHFIWSVRDRYLLGSIADSSQMPVASSSGPPAAAAAAAAPPPPPPLPMSFSPNLLNRLGAAAHPAATDEMEDVLTSEFFLTQVRNKEDFQAANIDPEIQKHLRFGRPDLAKAFAAMAETAKREGEARVAVLVCGPAGMVGAVRQLCVTAGSAAQVQFDFHGEEFAF
jgi:NADPH oxidase